MSYLLLFFSLLTHQPNYCSCIPLGPINDKQYNAYNLIVKGSVEKVIKSSPFERTIYLKIETCYKGGDSMSSISIATPDQAGMCGIFPIVGEEWLMFAYAEKKGFRTELCTRTKNMNPMAWDYNKNEIENDIKFLQAKRTTNNR